MKRNKKKPKYVTMAHVEVLAGEKIKKLIAMKILDRNMEKEQELVLKF